LGVFVVVVFCCSSEHLKALKLSDQSGTHHCSFVW
jgi:hypothetical protein